MLPSITNLPEVPSSNLLFHHLVSREAIIRICKLSLAYICFFMSLHPYCKFQGLGMGKEICLRHQLILSAWNTWCIGDR